MTAETATPIPHDAPIVKTGNLTGKYLGEEFLRLDLKGSDPIVEGLLWERDTSIFLAKEKSGKSLVSQYLALHLTTGHDFLGEFKLTISEKRCDLWDCASKKFLFEGTFIELVNKLQAFSSVNLSGKEVATADDNHTKRIRND